MKSLLFGEGLEVSDQADDFTFKSKTRIDGMFLLQQFKHLLHGIDARRFIAV